MVQPIEWIMSFSWRGVRGGHLGGGSEEWTRLKVECDSAITGRLAARSTAATKFHIIQYSRLVIKEEGNFVQIGTPLYLICT